MDPVDHDSERSPVVALIAAVLSFCHTHRLALHHGENPLAAALISLVARRGDLGERSSTIGTSR
ncbi:DUF2637 domain-containing protein [Microbispora sp. NPDC046933]|uniref:DUF2637 domain-containing protein n=1 Tax=Microbispora sp. NPDC046933 TaxID=3155618 RepID=UPI0033F8811C